MAVGVASRAADHVLHRGYPLAVRSEFRSMPLSTTAIPTPLPVQEEA